MPKDHSTEAVDPGQRLQMGLWGQWDRARLPWAITFPPPETIRLCLSAGWGQGSLPFMSEVG